MSVPVLTIDSYPGKTVEAVVGYDVTEKVIRFNGGPAEAFLKAIETLIVRAEESGADAVLGLRLSTATDYANNLFAVVAGTFVKFASDKLQPF